MSALRSLTPRRQSHNLFSDDFSGTACGGTKPFCTRISKTLLAKLAQPSHSITTQAHCQHHAPPMRALPSRGTDEGPHVDLDSKSLEYQRCHKLPSACPGGYFYTANNLAHAAHAVPFSLKPRATWNVTKHAGSARARYSTCSSSACTPNQLES